MGEIGAVTAAFTEALKRSRQSAIDLGDPMIGVGHIALGVIRAKEGSGFAALSRIHPEMHELESVVIDASRTSGELAGGTAEEQAQAPDGHSELDTGHLLLGILRERHSEVSDALARYGATYEAVERELTAG